MSTIEKNTAGKSSVSNKKTWIYRFLVIAILVFILQKFLGMISFRFFLFMDNMLRLTYSIHPIVMWAVLGLFTGLIYGSFVAWKKYRLDFKLNLIPVSIFLLIVFILIVVNKPFASELINNAVPAAARRTETINIDSLKKFIINRWITTDVKGKNSQNFYRIKNSVTSELEFTKTGECYMNQNGIRKALFYYAIAPDGKSLLFTNPKKTEESVRVQIISIKKDELVITSKIYQNDTVILKIK